MRKFWKNLRRSHWAQTRRFKRWHRHPLAWPIVVFVLLVAIGSSLAVVLSRQHRLVFHPYTSYIAIIKHDGEVQTVPTKEPTVGALLKKLDIAVGKGDRVEPGLTTAIAQDNFRINIYRAVPVTISDGATTTTAFTAAATPRSIAVQAGISLYAEDRVVVAPAENLVAEHSLGEHVTIQRAVPVTLNVYGTPLALRTQAKTVGALLKDRHVKVNPHDTVLPGQRVAITPGMQVFIVRNGTQIVTETQSIPAPVQTVTDTSLSFGTSAVRQQGSAGTQVLTYQVVKKNGVEVSRTLLQTVVTVQPVPTIVAQGQAVTIPADKQAVMAQAGIAPGDYKYVDYIASHEGGWCPTKIQGTHTCPAYMNPGDVPAYGGYGIFQATPGGKMASAGSDWATSAVTQIRWATGYAVARYGSWGGAYDHWISHHNW
jgi:uncharacterized protein YabE (DUF348 family)